MKNRAILITGVKWEADDMSDVKDLPVNVSLGLPEHIDIEDIEAIDDFIENKLSDKYSFTHNGWSGHEILEEFYLNTMSDDEVEAMIETIVEEIQNQIPDDYTAIIDISSEVYEDDGDPRNANLIGLPMYYGYIDDKGGDTFDDFNTGYYCDPASVAEELKMYIDSNPFTTPVNKIKESIISEITTVVVMKRGILDIAQSFTDPKDAEEFFASEAKKVESDLSSEDLEACLDNGYFENKGGVDIFITTNDLKTSRSIPQGCGNELFSKSDPADYIASSIKPG